MQKVGNNDDFIHRNSSILERATLWKTGNGLNVVDHSVNEDFLNIFEYLNFNRSSYGSASILFIIRCKLMTFYFYRRYLRAGVVDSVISTLMCRYDEIELAVLKILFAIHRKIIFGVDAKICAKEINYACNILGISHVKFLSALESKICSSGYIYTELSGFMDVWFYARSAKK